MDELPLDVLEVLETGVFLVGEGLQFFCKGGDFLWGKCDGLG